MEPETKPGATIGSLAEAIASEFRDGEFNRGNATIYGLRLILTEDSADRLISAILAQLQADPTITPDQLAIIRTAMRMRIAVK